MALAYIQEKRINFKKPMRLYFAHISNLHTLQIFAHVSNSFVKTDLLVNLTPGHSIANTKTVADAGITRPYCRAVSVSMETVPESGVSVGGGGSKRCFQA